MTLAIDPTLESLAIGFVTGVLSGAFGVGGGIFCTPVLRLLLNLPAHVAVGTTMALIIPTSIVGSVNYLKQQLVDSELVKLLAIPAVLATILGAMATSLMNGPLLMILFALMVALAGADLTFNIGKKVVLEKEKTEPTHGGTQKLVVNKRTAIILGFVVGFMAGFFGVGGGFILVPCLLYFFNVSVKAAFGTSLLVIAIVSLPATITHAMAGHVNFPLALLMVGGAMPGSWLGSFLALKLKDSYLRRGFGIIMLFVAVILATRELHSIQFGHGE